MAIINICDENRLIQDSEAVRKFLVRYGISCGHFDGEQNLGADPTDNEILEACEGPIMQLQSEGRCANFEVVRSTRNSPLPREELARFEREHAHLEDEVRIIVHGRALFHINPEGGSIFSIEVRSGDVINIPRGARHWFYISRNEEFCMIRLFNDREELEPEYTGSGVEKIHAPVFAESAGTTTRGDA